jgi:hypothetical protein
MGIEDEGAADVLDHEVAIRLLEGEPRRQGTRRLVRQVVPRGDDGPVGHREDLLAVDVVVRIELRIAGEKLAFGVDLFPVDREPLSEREPPAER